MGNVRQLGTSGLSVFGVHKIADGPPELWTATAVDRRGIRAKAAVGRGWSPRGAEVDALMKLVEREAAAAETDTLAREAGPHELGPRRQRPLASS
jgi:hypothetical protein